MLAHEGSGVSLSPEPLTFVCFYICQATIFQLSWQVVDSNHIGSIG